MTKGIVKLLVLIIAIVLSLSSRSFAADNDIEKDLQEKLKAGDSGQKEISTLIALSENIKASHLLLQEKFRAREEDVKTRGAMALERHRVMEEGYQKALAEYLTLIESLQSSANTVGAYGPHPGGFAEENDTPDQASRPDEGGMRGVIEDLKTLLDQILPKTKRPIVGSLPYRNLNYPSKEPYAGPSIRPAYKGGNKTVSPDDTQSTEEAPISEDIATLAQSLSWSPMLIYEYVKNTIETDWYWGCMKGAEETLRQKSGNDCDQSTLFAALLRASGFPTRYVRGTIEFFAGVKNLTGIDDPSKIAEFFQKAGIPYKPIIAGGKISNFQVEHIWIESRVPYGNYRGAIIDDSDPTWLGLDTSIKVKGYIYNTPMDIFDQSAISDELLVIRDEYLGTIQTQTPLEYVKDSIDSYLSQSQPGTTYSDFLRTRTLVPQILGLLPNSMQFLQKTITNEYTEIPDELKHKVRFTAADKNNSELFSITVNTIKLSNHQIALSYEPETVEDQETIDSYGGLDNTPAYLVRLRPILKVDGDMIVAATDGLPMGEEHSLKIELVSPNGTEAVTNTQIAGNVVAIGIVAGKVTPSRPPLPQGGDNTGAYGDAPSQDANAETILYKETINHIDRWNQAEDELASLLHLTVTRPIPTVVTVGGVVNITYLLDIPHGFEWKGVFIDASLRAINTGGAHGPHPGGFTEENNAPSSIERQKAFMQLSALQGSDLEHRIFEDDFRVDSISTAKLFEIANANQIPLIAIDKTNIATVLPTLPFDANIKDDISNSVNQNQEVRIPQSEITYDDWTGIGYVKENPDTGEAGYMLTGMIAGGMTAVSPGKWLSGDLKNILNKPYSANLVTTPVMVNIIFPYDGETLAVSPIDVEGTVSDPVAAVNVTGVKALVSSNGRFIARGVSLSPGVNQITAAATTLLGKKDSQTISVNYQPAQVSPITISITYPTDGAEISRPSTVVRGTVTTDAKEISIKINGMAADIYGNQFVINNMPLMDGDNVIIVNAIDSNGAVGRAEIAVTADISNPYITLSANITSGIPPLATYLQVSTATPNPIVSYQMDFDGDGVVDYTGDTFEDVTYTYTTEGIYYPTITVTDDQGNTYSDSIAITVLNKDVINALLKEKWEGMKEALTMGDIESALSFFTTRSKEKYRIMFNALKDQLPMIFGTFVEFNIENVYDIIAEFEIVANENGKLYSYPGLIINDSNGIWKFKDF